MINILIVDDCPRKTARVRGFIESLLVLDGISILESTNAYDAASLMKCSRFDLMILDILIPNKPGEEAKRDGGVVLLANLTSRKNLHAPSHIMGLTAHVDLAALHSDVFSKEMWVLVNYSESSDDWTEPLEKRLFHIADTKSRSSESNYNVDLAIITALEVPELEAVLSLDGGWREEHKPGDDTLYHRGIFQKGANSVSVVAASVGEMGMPAATGLAMKIINQFKPRYLAMAGIAAGVKGSFGDILIADQTWDYGSGKLMSRSFLGFPIPYTSIFNPAPSPILLNPLLRGMFDSFQRKGKSILKEMRVNWDGSAPAHAPEAFIGPVASGAAVLENLQTVKRIKRGNRKLIGIEMESYGVFLAARISPEPRPFAFSVKSICDFGSLKKNDQYQKYAAYSSASYIYAFAIDRLSHLPTVQ